MRVRSSGSREILAEVLEAGDRIPDARVWDQAREPVTLTDVVADRPALFLFYLFDWSST